MKTKGINKILVEYQQKRDAHKEQLKERKKKLYRKIPRLKAIDNQIRIHSLKTNKFIINNPDNIEEEI
jgi:DNA replication protein DnaC